MSDAGFQARGYTLLPRSKLLMDEMAYMLNARKSSAARNDGAQLKLEGKLRWCRCSINRLGGVKWDWAPKKGPDDPTDLRLARYPLVAGRDDSGSCWVLWLANNGILEERKWFIPLVQVDEAAAQFVVENPGGMTWPEELTVARVRERVEAYCSEVIKAIKAGVALSSPEHAVGRLPAWLDTLLSGINPQREANKRKAAQPVAAPAPATVPKRRSLPRPQQQQQQDDGAHAGRLEHLRLAVSVASAAQGVRASATVGAYTGQRALFQGAAPGEPLQLEWEAGVPTEKLLARRQNVRDVFDEWVPAAGAPAFDFQLTRHAAELVNPNDEGSTVLLVLVQRWGRALKPRAKESLEPGGDAVHLSLEYGDGQNMFMWGQFDKHSVTDAEPLCVLGTPKVPTPGKYWGARFDFKEALGSGFELDRGTAGRTVAVSRNRALVQLLLPVKPRNYPDSKPQ